jgi:hypothetical protein
MLGGLETCYSYFSILAVAGLCEREQLREGERESARAMGYLSLLTLAALCL